jgi:hypothetical protein
LKLRTYRRLFLALCALFLLVSRYPCYTGDILRTDDFSRVADNAQLDAAYFRTLLLDNRSDGFYRPLNHLSFGLTHHFFDFRPLPYALFNLLLVLGCVWVLFHVLLGLSRSAVFASLGAFGWLLNVEPIHAVLSWGVGRTAALYTLFVLLALGCVLRARRSRPAAWLAAAMACLFLALLAKESAVTGPVLVLMLIGVETARGGALRRRHLIGAAVAAALVYGVYFALRSASQAMTPATAPVYYRLDFSPAVLARNFAGYLSRSLLYSALLVPAFFLRPRPATPTHPAPARVSRGRAVAVGLLLFALTVAPELAVPSRSSLYAFFPSAFVTATLAALLAGSGRWPRRRSELRGLLVMLAVVGALVAPIAWGRGASVARGGTVYRWSRAIADRVALDRHPVVALRYDPAAVELSAKNLDLVRMGVGLMLRRPVTIEANPQRPPPRSWTFELFPGRGGEQPGIRLLAGPGAAPEGEAPHQRHAD